MDIFFIFCAQYLFVAAFIVALTYFLRQPRKLQVKIIVLGFMSAVISYAIALIAGRLYFDPRPFVEGNFKPLIPHDTENGFPSDHVLMLSVIAGVVTLYNRGWAALLWTITVIVAYSRVYVGVHHYLDVLVSAVISLAVIAGTCLLVRGKVLEYFCSVIDRLLQRVVLDQQK